MSSLRGGNEVACSALFASHVVRRICNAVGLRRRSTVGEPTCPVALHHRSSPRSVFRPRVVDSLVWRFTLVCRSPARWGSVVCCRTVRGAGSLIVRRRHSGLDRSAAAGMALLPEYGGARTACGEEAGRPIHKSRSPPDPPHPGELRAPLGAAEPSPPGAVQHRSGELLEARAAAQMTSAIVIAIVSTCLFDGFTTPSRTGREPGPPTRGLSSGRRRLNDGYRGGCRRRRRWRPQ